MRAFLVKEGTEGKVVAPGVEWYAHNIRPFTTTRELMFFEGQVRVDPLGKFGSGPGDATPAGGFAKAGYYGFEGDRGWVLLVRLDQVLVV